MPTDIQIAEGLTKFHISIEWIFNNIDMIARRHVGIIAVYGQAVVASGPDVERVRMLARASSHPPEDIVLMVNEQPSCP